MDSKPLVMENSIDLKAPTFIFDYAATKKHTSADRGLTEIMVRMIVQLLIPKVPEHYVFAIKTTEGTSQTSYLN